jgi:hypothetical protein
MLRHIETAPITASAQVIKKPQPFTPEEIAQAIAELEKERHGVASEQEESAQLSSILEQLQLDLPAAKVAEQVQKARTRRQMTTKRRRRVLIASVAIVGSLLGLIGGIWPGTHKRNATVASGPMTAAKERPLTTQTITPAQLIVVDHSRGGPVSKTLAEVPEGVRVSLKNNVLQKLLGVPPGYIDSVQDADVYDWVAFRKGDACYIRGYTETRRTRDALRVTPIIKIHNNKGVFTPDGKPLAPVPVTIPLNTITLAGEDWINTQLSYGIVDVRVDDPKQVTFD